MELLNENEIHRIIEPYGFTKVVNWSVQDYSNELVGYLGDHLTLIIDVGSEALKLFVKCMPRADQWKANYINELSFFKKEYFMLSRLFRKFKQGKHAWRPKLLLIREDLFVFEDVTVLGYRMPNSRDTLTLDELKACVVTMANFHASSLIYEENRSIELNRSYRIWDEYSNHLKEPSRGFSWRTAGRNAVIDFLKVYSRAKQNPKFVKDIDSVVVRLFEEAVNLMQPSLVHRNVVVHRDLWSNNIFLRKENDGRTRAIFVDFQTVIYCPPMMDLCSFIYFNTTRTVRESHIDALLDLYYEVLSENLRASNLDMEKIFDRETLGKCYQDCIPFGVTQAALIVPITAIHVSMKEILFCDPETLYRINEVTRSAEFIKIAKDDTYYRDRVLDIFDEIVDRYVCQPTM